MTLARMTPRSRRRIGLLASVLPALLFIATSVSNRTAYRIGDVSAAFSALQATHDAVSRSSFWRGAVAALAFPFSTPCSAAVATVQPSPVKASPPEWKSEFNSFPEGLFDSRVPPRIAWLPYRGDVDPFGDAIRFPSWLEGKWRVKFTKRDIKFPQGWLVLNENVPGVAMASILRLPNVGAEPVATWRFALSEDGKTTRADWSTNLPSTLDAFWDRAKSIAVQRKDGSESVGIRGQTAGLALTYEAPLRETSQKNRTTRIVTSTWLGGQSWEDLADRSCLAVEWVRQRDPLLEPNSISDYKVLTALGQASDGSVAGLLRVAAFLQPADDNYIESNNSAVAVYDYSVNLTRVKE